MKLRDPYEIISSLDRLDRVEFDPYNDPVLGEKVIEIKRQKLMASWGKLMAFNKKENKERYDELKRIEATYNDRRDNIMREYKAIRSTENVDIDAIPLPSMAPPVPSMSSLSSSTFMNANYQMPVNRKPPGCPQGLPPKLEELDIDDVESSEDEAVEEKKNENNLSEFLKEIEAIAGDDDKAHKDKDNEEDDEEKEEDRDEVVISSLPPIQTAPPVLLGQEIDDDDVDGEDLEETGENDDERNEDKEEQEPLINRPLAPPPPLPLTQPPALFPFRPVLSLRPPQLAPQLRPIAPGTGPHPPFPPRQRLPFQSHVRHPLDYHQPKPPQRQEPKTTTIEAKPQLRNLAHDATRFLPTALRNKPRFPVKKSVFPVPDPGKYSTHSRCSYSLTNILFSFPQLEIPLPEATPSPSTTNKTLKDDAYDEFMKEMEGLM